MEIDSSREKELSLSDKGSKLEERMKKLKQDLESKDSAIRQLTDELSANRKSLEDTKK